MSDGTQWHTREKNWCNFPPKRKGPQSKPTLSLFPSTVWITDLLVLLNKLFKGKISNRDTLLKEANLEATF